MELKNKFKLNKSEEKTYTRIFKSGEELSYLSYKVPKTNDNYIQEDLMTDIMDFANYKSENMKKSKKFKNSKISIAIEYKSGKFISTQYVDAGDNIKFMEYEEYADQEIEDFGDIKSFTIQIIN